MAKINSQSVRGEVERVKAQFEQLVAYKKINTETTILFQSMLMLINLLVAIFLERTTKKNEKNSSIPLSQTEKEESSCNATTNGIFPPDMKGPLSYGNGLKAYIIRLLICQMITLNRVQKLVKAMIGEVIAEATLLKFVFRFYQALESWETDAIQQ